MAVSGAASINQVSDIFSDLSANAQKASIEIARLAAITAKGLDLSGAAEQLGDLFKDLIQPVQPEMEKLATLADKVGAALSDLASGNLSKMKKAVGALGDSMAEVSKSNHLSALQKMGQQMGIAAAGLVSGVIGSGMAIAGFVGTVSRIGGLLVGAFTAVVAGATKLATSFLNIPGWFQSAISPIQRMFNSISPFVGALNPAYLIRFQSAMLDLQAVIGRAMVPFATGLTRLTRAFADMMVPVSQILKPVFQVLGQIVQQVGTSIMAIFGAALIQMGPSLQKFAIGLGDAITRIVGAVGALLPTLMQGVEVFVSWLGETAVPWIGKFVESLINGTNGMVNNMKGVAKTFNAIVFFGDLLVLGLKGLTSAFMQAVEAITRWIPGLSGTVTKKEIDDINGSIRDQVKRMEGKAPEDVKVENDIRNFQANLKGTAEQLKKMAGSNASLGAANRGSAYSGVADLGKNLMQQTFGQSPIEERQLTVLERIALGVWQMADGRKVGPQGGAVGGPGVNGAQGPGWLGNIMAAAKAGKFQGDGNGA